MGEDYLFGDTDIAARRLEVLAEVFAESSRTFLLEACNDTPGLALDLGCGPGFTTHLLADAIKCGRVVGLDNSERFLALAAKTETKRVSFRLHDVTAVPFPEAPADLIYCRFLMTHLKEPQQVIGKWATQSRRGGLMLLEEVEWIRTSNPPFETYLGIVDRMLAHQGTQLYIGPMLDRMEAAHLSKRGSRMARLRVPNYLAATMFFMNILSWKHQPFIQATCSPESIEQLQQAMEAIAGTLGSETEIEWGLRQIVFERVAS